MGEFKGTMLIVGVFIYFTFFILIVSSTESISSTLPDNISSEYLLLSTDALCNSPRYRYDPITGDSKPFTGGYLALLDCDNSRGILSQTECEAIYGCTWENVTLGSWFFGLFGGETTASCTGYINTSYYNIDNETSFGRPVVSSYTSLGYWDDDDETTSNVCRHPSVIADQENCSVFSCTWQEFDYTQRYNNPSNFISTMGDVFTFRYNFGFDNTGVRTLLNILFVVIPMLLFIVGVYMSLPLIH